jgi:hypothetical protein
MHTGFAEPSSLKTFLLKTGDLRPVLGWPKRAGKCYENNVDKVY